MNERSAKGESERLATALVAELYAIRDVWVETSLVLQDARFALEASNRGDAWRASDAQPLLMKMKQGSRDSPDVLQQTDSGGPEKPPE